MSAFPPRGQRWVVAHRGASALRPENTAAAFEQAIQDEADAAECDLRLTADGRVVICHDADLAKFGRPDVRVDATPLDELQQVDAGGWFDAAYVGERLLSLDQLLERFADRLPLCLELKTDPEDNANRVRGDRLRTFADAVAGPVANFPARDRLSLLAFDPDAIRELHAAGCDNLVFNVHEPDQLTAADLDALPPLSAVDCNIHCLAEPTAELIRTRGLRLIAYTCNGPADVAKAAGLGVEAIITDDPRQTRDILHRLDRPADAT